MMKVSILKPGDFLMGTCVFFLEQLDTATGRLLLVTDGEAVRAVDWEDHEARMQKLLQRHYGKNVEFLSPATPSQAFYAIQAYFSGDTAAVDQLKTATNGTDFQKKVWAELRKIRAGETVSYGELAARIGKPTAARAVGLANGSNPIPIVVPCHRVIGSD